MKSGSPAEDEAEGAVGDDAGQAGGHDDFRLEIGRAVQHLGGEQGAGQRGAEDGGDAGTHAGRHEHAPLGGLILSSLAKQRAEAGADLRDRPFAAAGTARADRQGAGDDLDERHAAPDLALFVVIGGDGRIGAVPFRLGGEA